MQATKGAEQQYQLTIKLGGRKFETEQQYTRAQAEEISRIAVESARAARGNDQDILPRPIEVVG